MKDWLGWHKAYDDPASSLVSRLEVVKRQLGLALDRVTLRARGSSLCAGDGRDVISVLAARGDRPQVTAVLVEKDPTLAHRARSAAAGGGLGSVRVRCKDAGDLASFADVLPVDVLMLCGIFGNIEHSSVKDVVDAIPWLVTPGGFVIWTRGRSEPDRRPEDPQMVHLRRPRRAGLRGSARALRRRPKPATQHLDSSTSRQDPGSSLQLRVAIYDTDRSRGTGAFFCAEKRATSPLSFAFDTIPAEAGIFEGRGQLVLSGEIVAVTGPAASVEPSHGTGPDQVIADEESIRTQDPGTFCEGGAEIADVMEHEHGHDGVEPVVCERKTAGVGRLDDGATPERGQAAPGCLEHYWVHVGSGDAQAGVALQQSRGIGSGTGS